MTVHHIRDHIRNAENDGDPPDLVRRRINTRLRAIHSYFRDSYSDEALEMADADRLEFLWKELWGVEEHLSRTVNDWTPETTRRTT